MLSGFPWVYMASAPSPTSTQELAPSSCRELPALVSVPTTHLGELAVVPGLLCLAETLGKCLCAGISASIC